MIVPSCPRIYVVIVNWNGWKDTVECLESVFHLRYDNFVAIVCDNGSSDGSLQRIMEWSMGDRRVLPLSTEMGPYTSPPIAKPIPFLFLEASHVSERQWITRDERLILIRSENNLGFAGGNNLGLRHILSRNDEKYVWLLNNDTVVHPDALGEQIMRIEEDPRIGICGSKLCFYTAPGVIQACGGSTYRPMTGRNTHIGVAMLASARDDRAAVERRMDYVVGASMFVSRDFLLSVGLMSEDYFLYYEELDWAVRARGRFLQGYAPGSVVYHKQGRSLGGNWLGRRSGHEDNYVASDFYSVRNQIRFTRRYYPQYLPTVAVTVAWRLLKRIAAGKRKRAWAVVRGVRSAFSKEAPRSGRGLERGCSVGVQ